MTLAELMVAMGVLSIAMLALTTTFAGVQRAIVDVEVRSQANDEARLALQTIDREVRSGNLLYSPNAEAGNDPYDALATGYLFRVYTQAKHQPSDDSRCAVWLIDDQEQLLYRWWPPLDETSATNWRVVADGVVNRTLGVPAFTVSADGRTATVSFRVNANYTTDPNATKVFTTAVTGRNTSFGYPATLCEDLPPDM